MKRIIVGILLTMFLVACGGGGTTVVPEEMPQPVEPSGIFPGTFIGTIGVVDPPADKKYGGLTTVTIDKQGVVTGTITPIGETDNTVNGTYTGTATLSGVRDVLLELDIVFPGIGTYKSKLKSEYFENTDRISGETDIRDAATDFVGNASIAVARDKTQLSLEQPKPPVEVVDTFKGTLSLNDELADYDFDSLVTMSIDADGNVAGTLVDESASRGEIAKGTVTGRITTYNKDYLLLDLEITYDGFGTYKTKTNGSYFENTDRILGIGGLHAKNGNGVFVGTGNLIVTRE